MKNFVLIGAAGYIAPRHLKAIKDTGNNLLAALDPHDSVGVLDQYFPGAHFFTEFERFDRHCEKLRRSGTPIDYVTVCSPNYLHDAHIRFGLRIGADVICEKPVVLNPWNIDALLEIEKETGRHVYTILQLRQHPAILALKEKIGNNPADKKYAVDLTYITPRGNWYQHSWKGDLAKSGGIATNIGLHFFDVLLWLFGNVVDTKVIEHTAKKTAGHIEFEKANVNWKLSIAVNDLPPAGLTQQKKTFRSLIIDGKEIQFSDGFEELHTRAYKEVLAGKGITLPENKRAIQLVHDIRNFAAPQKGNK